MEWFVFVRMSLIDPSDVGGIDIVPYVELCSGPFFGCLCVSSQTATWQMSWWFLVRVAESEWETLTPRDAW